MKGLTEFIFEDVNKLIKSIDLFELNNKSILITGASGLIGVHFLATLNTLVNKKAFVIKTYSCNKSEPTEFFKKLADFQGSEILRGDITDYNFLNCLPEVDFVIHAAGYGQPGKFMDDQVKTIKINTFSTFELFRKLKPNGKFLFVSTSELYSGLQNPPFNETQIGTTNTDHPRSCYIEAKRCGEAIVNAQRKLNVSAKSARLSLAYGPGTQMGDKRVLNSFIEKALKGDIQMMDAGEAERTYCYVSDAVEIMLHILLNGKDAIYNVGGKSRTTIKELAYSIANYLNVSVSAPESSIALVGAPDNVFLDMAKVEAEFGKNQYLDLGIGLAKTIEWQKILYNFDKF